MDDIDRAALAEDRHRQRALESQQAAANAVESPLEVNGVRVCVDCGVVIPKKRLEAYPEAVRCVDCKEIKEQRQRRFR